MDNHALAYCRIVEKSGKEVEPGDERVEQVRTEAETHLSSFPGRTRTIDGRPYLSFTDYRAWKGRLLKGDLRKKREAGFVRESVNEWVSKQSRKAELAGIPVDEIGPWTGEFPREAVPLQVLPERLASRRKILDAMGRFLTYPAFTHPGTEKALKHTEKFRKRAREWVELLRDAKLEIQRYVDAEHLLSRRYFSGEDLYFPAMREELDSLVAGVQQAEELYEEGVAPELARGQEPKARTSDDEKELSSDDTDLGRETARRAKEHAGHLLVLARAETLENLGRKNEGIALVEEWLEEIGM